MASSTGTCRYRRASTSTSWPSARGSTNTRRSRVQRRPPAPQQSNGGAENASATTPPTRTRPIWGPIHYAGVAAALPGNAFADDNKNDQWIYAQAMVHDIDVLASRNRNTMLIEVLKEHFVACGYPDAPVTVRSLWEHTTALADAESRSIAEVALETVLCAVMPSAWTGSPEETVAVKWSTERFVRNLRTRDGFGETPDSEREKLAHLLHHTVKESSLATLLDRCNKAYAILPENARETEMRYHTATRAAVRTTGVDLWER